MIKDRNDFFIGTWRLLAYWLEDENGNKTYPYGENPIGYIMYSKDGYMSVAFMENNRKLFNSDDTRGGTDEDKAIAMDSYFTYFGKYEIIDNKIYHHIEISLLPNWKGTTQERIYEIDGSRLTLSTPPLIVYGKLQKAFLVWEKDPT